MQSLSRSSLAQISGAGAPSEDLNYLTLAQVAERIRAGSLTSVEVTEACLARIKTYNPKLDAFITVPHEKALAQARALDAEKQAGKLRGPLHGVPIALKDNIDTAGLRTTAGSAVFEYRVPETNAPVVDRLTAAGAVMIGKANLHEFAMGAGEASFWGPARNPWKLEHNTGGSSSGSGAAVSAGMCYAALGTDTAGSIRHPASYCGVVGLKPTYGLVPIRGIAPLVVSLDHCGPLTRTVEDTALVLQALAGYDRLDFTSFPHPTEDYVAAMRQPVSEFRLGKPIGYFDLLNPEVEQAFNVALEVLTGLTKSVAECTLPPADSVGYTGFAPMGETWAYHQEYFKTLSSKYQLGDRKRLEMLSTANVKAEDYIRLKWQLETLKRTIDDSFVDVDLMVMPTMRILPPLLDDLIRRAVESKPGNPGVMSNCAPMNAFGTPSISVPCGFSKNGLPIGLMITGPRFSEGKVLALAHAYEQATEWHKRRPTLTPDMPVPSVMKI